MTSTNIQIGFGSDIKSSSKCVSDGTGMDNSTRVLKPPGGGSSDIFGGNGYDTPRSGNKNHFASNIFAQPEAVANNGLTPRRGRNNDSHSRLFGEPDRSAAQGKNHSRSNIPIGGDETDRKSTASSVPSKTSITSNGQTNGKMENGGSQSHISNGNGNKDGGNPVTGEGYTGSRNGLDSNAHVPAVNGANQVINKNRVPPGGFSSGLW
jgi:hypothetical protein